MGILGNWGRSPRKIGVAESLALAESKRMLEEATQLARKAAGAWTGGGTSWNHIMTVSYDGEKNVGEIGPLKEYALDHNGLRARSWQCYLDSEIAQIVIGKFTTWVIGPGLKLQSEPKKDVLESEKISFGEVEVFNKLVEARFGVYADSTMADHADMETLHEIAKTAFINAIVGGDVLVVQRYEEGVPKTQLIDGAYICTPYTARRDIAGFTAENGNRIVNGIEIDETGRHIAYHVRTGTMTWERIEARGKKSGQLYAFMVYGFRYRLRDLRGIPLIAAVMETAAKMERYKEATLGSAEERAKLPFVIEHGIASTGENPMARAIVNSFNGDKQGDIPQDVNGEVLQNKAAATLNKTVLNLPNDTTIKSPFDGKTDLAFRDFYTINIDMVCATLGVPPNVAMSKYDSNFSASRAALKDWEHTIKVWRKYFGNKFYKPVYSLFLETQVLQNKISAPGYLIAVAKGNRFAVEAYQSCRFVGPNVPHIDPLKEVMAERAKLGADAANMPLTTMEAAAEALGSGDYAAILEQYAREIRESEALDIQRTTSAPATQPPPDTNTNP